MTPRVAAVVPVKDGARYLAEVLAALAREAVDEVLVIDSGSRDGSVEIARGAGVEVLEIAPADFGHGRTRNLGAERTSAEIVAFLTQDATPVPGWRAALRRGVRGRPADRRRLRPASPAAGHQPDDRARADRVLRDVRRRRRRAPRVRRGRPDVPLQRGHGVPQGVLGGDPLRRRPVQRGPGVRPRARRAPCVAEGLRAASRGAARARLPAGGVHAPLLRRVPRAARDDRARRADRRALDGARRPRARRERPSLDARAGDARGDRDALDRPLGGAPHRPQGVLGARQPGQPPARARPERAVARGPRRRRRAARSPRRRCRTCRPRSTSRRGTRRTATRRSSA